MNEINQQQVDTKKRLFLLAIFFYILIWTGIIIYESTIFGPYATYGLLPLALIPLYVSLRIYLKWNKRNKFSFVSLMIALTIVISGTCYLIQDWDSKGLDAEYARDLEFIEFTQIIRKDNSFRDVQCHERVRNRKGGPWISGSVYSHEDLERLKTLSNQYQIPGIDKISVNTVLE